MICKKLLDLALPLMEGLTIQELRVGLGYVVVKNSDGGVGTAYVLRDRLPEGCSLVGEAGTFNGKDLSAAAQMFLNNENVLKASIGLACINSAARFNEEDIYEGDVIEYLDLKKDSWVGMIGNFKPMIKGIKKKTPHLFIIEDKPEYRTNGAYKIFDEILSSCDVLIITATTLINKTFTDTLTKTCGVKKKIVLGPSTPLFKEFYKGLGINFASGIQVKDPDKVMDIISQGGGTCSFKDYIRKVNLITA